MKLQQVWEKYGDETEFNLSFLPEDLIKTGRKKVFKPQSLIVSQGEELKNIYFIQSGEAIGKRDYSDGKEYKYFGIDKRKGCIGLLELLARHESFVATIISLSEVTIISIDAAAVYEYIMSDISILRRCATLVAGDLYITSGRGGIFYYVDGLNRIRYYLAEYFEKNKQRGIPVRVEVQYQEMASYTGISVRTVGRSLQKLRESGEIISDRKKIYIGQEQYHKLMDALWSSDFM